MSSKKLKLGVLVSGNGTNLEAIIGACKGGHINAEVSIVISDVADAHALERAKNHSIPSAVILRNRFSDKTSFENEIIKVLNVYGVELVCLAGFMRILGETLLSAYPLRIVNIHPALLPSFPGLDAQGRAFEYGVKVSGCTVHFVDRDVDHGPIILQTPVPVLESDTAELLQKRILSEEHKLYPRAIGLIADGLVKVKNRRVYILEKKS